MLKASCLTVTQPGRENLLSDAVADFQAQTWPDKELIVLTDSTDSVHLAALEAAIGHAPNVYLAFEKSGYKLGQLRNLVAERASGDVCVQWDDDDRYLPQRLAYQVSVFEDRPAIQAVCLDSQLCLFTDTSAARLAWVCWRRAIPGTIAYRRKLPVCYPDKSKGEDDDFLSLFDRKSTCVLGWAGEVYLRRYHGANTWDAKHFHDNVRGYGLPLLAWNAGCVLNALRYYGYEPANNQYLLDPGRGKDLYCEVRSIE